MSDFWRSCLAHFEQQLPPQQFKTWIKPLRIENEGSALVLVAPNRFVLQWIRDRFLAEIQTLARQRYGEDMTVTLTVAERDATAPARAIAPEPVQATRAAARDVTRLNPDFGFGSFVAQQNQPIIVNYTNDLRDLTTGQLRTSHYFPVDPCPHGPMEWRDAPRTVVHLHGGHVPPRFDGLPEYDFFPGASDTYEYPNNQEPTTFCFHDHSLGITRLNVTMGLAAFYLLRDSYENGLIAANQLPSGAYEHGIVFQDRDFFPDGSFDYEPALDISNQMFHGKNILVNGKVWPYMNISAGDGAS